MILAQFKRPAPEYRIKNIQGADDKLGQTLWTHSKQ